MDTMRQINSANTRRLLLIALLIVLGGGLLLDKGFLKLPSLGSAGPQTVDGAATRLAQFRGVIASRSEIERTITTVTPAYTQMISGLLAFNDSATPAKNIAMNSVRAILTEILGRNNNKYEEKVEIISDSILDERATQVRLDVTFTSYSDEAALMALGVLSLADTGTQWESFSLRADREGKNITIIGRLLVLVLQAIE